MLVLSGLIYIQSVNTAVCMYIHIHVHVVIYMYIYVQSCCHINVCVFVGNY